MAMFKQTAEYCWPKAGPVLVLSGSVAEGAGERPTLVDTKGQDTSIYMILNRILPFSYQYFL